MTSNAGNTVTFLRTSREFPQDPQALQIELTKAYLDTANAVNIRTAGVFYKNRSIPNGENWYISNRKQDGQRQIYTFTATGSIPHGINISQIGGFVRIFGTFTDGTVWYPLPYVDVTAANNQVSLSVTATNIVITAGAGAPPAIVNGFVVLEWITA